MRRIGIFLLCALSICGCKSEPSKGDDPARPRLRTDPASSASSATETQSYAEDAAALPVPTAKEVCGKLGDALKKKGGMKAKRIAKRVQSCIRKATQLEKEDARLYGCVARCGIKAELLDDFDKCDEQCDGSGKKKVAADEE
jgi:hypothetical protein